MRTKPHLKAARRFVIDSRAMGKSDHEIYKELAAQFPNKKRLALLITGTGTPAESKKYKWHTIILLLLLGLVVFGILFRLAQFIRAHHPPMETLLTALKAVFITGTSAFAILEISKSSALGYLAAIGIAMFAFNLERYRDLTFGNFLTVEIIVLGFFLYKRIFPNFKPFGLKKDEAGEYSFD
jgi:hypothetical protein